MNSMLVILIRASTSRSNRGKRGVRDDFLIMLISAMDRYFRKVLKPDNVKYFSHFLIYN